MIADTPPEIVITALARPTGDVAYDSVTIATDTLTGTAAGRIEDILGGVAGFQQFRRTDSRAANPTSQGATLRAIGGNASSRALVLVDGAPVADPFAGYIPWFALVPERLASVRVTRGAGAGAFGEGALAGTIELTSADPTAARAGAEVDGGSYGSVSARGSVAVPLAGGGVALSAREDRADGYRLIPAGQRGPADIPAAYDQHSIALRAVVPAGVGTLSLDALAYDDRRTRGVAGVTSHDTGFLGSLRLTGGSRWRFDALAYLDAPTFATTAVSLDPTRTVATPSSNQFNTPAIGAGGKIEVRPPRLGPLDLRFGANVKDASGRSEEFARFVGQTYTQLRVTGGTNTVAGGFAEASLAATNTLIFTATGRVDHWTIADGYLDQRDLTTGALTGARYADRDRVEPTGRAGAAWTLTPGVTLRGAGYTGYRLPTLNELYRPFRVGLDATAANAALVPERLRGGEVGIDIGRPGLKLALTAFANHVANAIGNATGGVGPGTFDQVGFVAAGGVFRRRVNLPAIDARGIEAELHGQRGRWRLDLSYAYTAARVAAPGTTQDGLAPANTPQQAGALTLGWAGPVRASVTARYAGPQFDDDLSTRRLGSATTVDAEVDVPLARRLSLTFRAENIADALVASGVSASGVIDRGTPRTLWAGVRVGSL